jgi:hypothetical protein
MSNDFYTATGSPSTRSAGSSSTMRSEFAAIEDAFDKLPTMTGNADKVVLVDSGGVALTTKAFIAGNMSNTPAGGISATTVQAAINELDSEKLNKAFPACRAGRTGTATVPVGDSFGILGSFHEDKGGFTTGSTVGIYGGALHVVEAGYYLVMLSALFDTASDWGALSVMKNNTSTVAYIRRTQTSVYESRSMPGIVYMDAGDYFNYKSSGSFPITLVHGKIFTEVNITYIG